MSLYIPSKPPVKLPQKAGPTGPGAGVLTTEYPLSSLGNMNTPQQKMAKYWAFSFQVPWIAAAEDAIIERFSGVDWHLEDEDNDEIDDDYPNKDAQSARLLIEKPSANLKVGAPFYRSDLWALTARAMGICGSAFILLDQEEALGNTPAAMLPLAPWRMTPVADPKGNLIGWLIDKTATDPGIAVRLDQVLHYQLRRNFIGHFGVGLMESAMLKASISQGLDSHVGMVLDAGGRLSGIMSPKTGTVPPEIMLQMERDWRTVVDQSDAAKRLQLVAAPIQFDRTTLTPAELQLAAMMDNARDSLLTLWGVPLTIVGGSAPTGLNSGDSRKFDEAAIWQGPVHSRLTVFREVTQFQLLDRWADLGAPVELEIDEPEFDDDGPRFDLLVKSLTTPMRNAERRALISLDPFGPQVVGITGTPLDDEVWLPATQVLAFSAAIGTNGYQPAAISTQATPEAGVIGGAEQDDEAINAAGEQSTPIPLKARTTPPVHPRFAPLHTALVNLRNRIAASKTPIIKRSLRNVLEDQKHEIATRLRKNAEHMATHPGDSEKWFPAKTFDAKLSAALSPHLAVMADHVNATIHDVLPVKPAKAAPPGAVERVMTRGAARVTKINETTRQKINEAIYRALEAGSTIPDVADAIEGIGTTTIGDLDLGALFDDYRAEMIARTELMDAYNASAIASYSDAGFDQVQAIDGDDDAECAERDGQVYSSDEADGIEDHPNGTLDWVPVIDSGTPEEADEPIKASVAPKSIADAIAAIGASHSEDMAAARATTTDALAAVAASHSDLASQIAALANVPHVVQIAEGAVQVSAPVNVPAPKVTVQAGDTHVHIPPPAPRTIKRDNVGNITGIE